MRGVRLIDTNGTRVSVPYEGEEISLISKINDLDDNLSFDKLSNSIIKINYNEHCIMFDIDNGLLFNDINANGIKRIEIDISKDEIELIIKLINKKLN